MNENFPVTNDTFASENIAGTSIFTFDNSTIIHQKGLLTHVKIKI